MNKLYCKDHNIMICEGSKIRLKRFKSYTWICRYGWYSFGGNREIFGWYLQEQDNFENIKPLECIDFSDMYVIEN